MRGSKSKALRRIAAHTNLPDIAYQEQEYFRRGHVLVPFPLEMAPCKRRFYKNLKKMVST
jgi:hypothetical protein